MSTFTRNVKKYTCCYERTAVVLFAFVSIVLLLIIIFIIVATKSIHLLFFKFIIYHLISLYIKSVCICLLLYTKGMYTFLHHVHYTL